MLNKLKWLTLLLVVLVLIVPSVFAAAPTIASVDINSTNPATNATNRNITIYPRGVADTDNNYAIQNITNWYRNGSSILIVNDPFETNYSNMSTNYSNISRNYAAFFNLTGAFNNGSCAGGNCSMTT